MSYLLRKVILGVVYVVKLFLGVVQGIVTGIRGLCNGLGPALYGLIFYIFHVNLNQDDILSTTDALLTTSNFTTQAVIPIRHSVRIVSKPIPDYFFGNVALWTYFQLIKMLLS